MSQRETGWEETLTRLEIKQSRAAHPRWPAVGHHAIRVTCGAPNVARTFDPDGAIERAIGRWSFGAAT